MTVTAIELRVSRTGSVYMLVLDLHGRVLTAVSYRSWGHLLREQGRAAAAAPALFVRSDELDELRGRADHADKREFTARGGY